VYFLDKNDKTRYYAVILPRFLFLPVPTIWLTYTRLTMDFINFGKTMMPETNANLHNSGEKSRLKGKFLLPFLSGVGR